MSIEESKLRFRFYDYWSTYGIIVSSWREIKNEEPWKIRTSSSKKTYIKNIMKKTLMKGVLTIMDVVKAIQEEVVSIYQTIKNIKKKSQNSYSLRKHGMWCNST